MTLPFNSDQLNKFRETIRASESGSQGYRAENTYGYIGAYQFGAQALEDVGLIKKGVSKKGNKSLDDEANWVTPGGKAAFMADSTLQDQAFDALTELNYKRITNLPEMKGRDVPVEDVAGLLAAAHLKGVTGGAKAYLNNTVTSDAFNTTNYSYYDLGKGALSGEAGGGSKSNMYIASEEAPTILDVVNRAQTPEVPFSEAFASGRRESPIQMSLEAPNLTGEFDTTYNPLDDIKGYEEFASEFVDLPNRESVDKYKSHLDDLQGMREKQQGLGGFLGSMAWGLYSPTTIIPGIGWASKAVQGASKMGRFAVGAGLTTAAAGIDEAILHEADPTRQSVETYLNLSAAAALGGLLYTVGGSVKLPRSKATVENWRDVIQDAGDIEISQSTAGAMQVSLKGEKIIRNPIFNAAFALAKKTSPGLRVLGGKSTKASEIGNKLFTHNFLIGKNLDGFGEQSVESMIRAKVGRVNKPLMAIDHGWIKLKKSGTDLSRDQFNSEVSKAVRRGGVSDNPHIAKAAKSVQGYFKAQLQRLKKNKLLPDEFDNPNYLSSVFRHEKILLQKREFLDQMKVALKRQNDKLTSDELAEIADDVADKILHGNVRLPKEMRFKAGPLKNRTLNIDPNDLDEFLDNDIEFILNRYARSVETDIAFNKQFGSADMDIQLREIELDYENMIKAVQDSKLEIRAKDKKILRLVKERQTTLTDIKAIRDRIQGKYKMPEDPYSLSGQLPKAAQAYSFAAVGGGIALAQIPDLAHVMVARAMSGPLGKDITKFGKVLKGLKLSKDDLLEIGVGHETWATSRAFEVADLGADEIMSGTRMDKLIRKHSGKFMNIALINQMNDFTRRMSANHVANRMIIDFQKHAAGRLPKARLDSLSKLGIGPGDMSQALKEFAKHSTKIDGVRMANMHLWNADTFKLAIREEVDNLIIIPGAADRSLWMSSGLGKVLSQFMGFAFAFQNKILLPGLQRADKEFLGKLTGLVFLGAATSQLRRALDGRELIDNPEELILEGIDRSGATGLLFDIHNKVQSFTGIGAATLLTDRQRSRFATQNAWTRVMGPLPGIIDNFRVPISNIVNGNGSEADIKKMWRALPFQNLFYTKLLTNMLRDSLAEEIF